MTGEVVVREGNLAVRRMRATDEDFAQLLAWRREPHVAAVWDEDEERGDDMTLEDVREAYGAQTEGGQDPTASYFILLEDRPVGYVQWHRWGSYAEEARDMGWEPDERSWGIDIFIGDPTELGKGLGPRAVDLVCRHLFTAEGASDVTLVTAADNARAQRAYEKAGMTKVRRVLDVDRRGGVRIKSWLMRRAAPP
jgi:RimJ/RimL family protein N-acetyltransferase